MSDSHHRPKPGWGDTETTRIVSGPAFRFGGQIGQAGGPRLELRGCRASPGAPGARAVLTQAPTSRRAAASSSRVRPVPGNRSGLLRRLSTAWASARPRATRRSRAHDCGERARVREAASRARAAPPPPALPRRLARLTQGRGGSLLGRKEQLCGLQLRVSSACGARVGVRLSLLAALRGAGKAGIPTRRTLPAGTVVRTVHRTPELSEGVNGGLKAPRSHLAEPRTPTWN